MFLLLGMLAGEDGPGGIVFNDFHTSYLVGSIALSVILFEGGLKLERTMIQAALRPAVALATVGVACTAAIVAATGVGAFFVSWPDALLIGAVLAPTDAAAVNTLLRAARVAVPKRVIAALELESGINDPMSVFLTMMLVHGITMPDGISPGRAVLMFVEEMGGGAIAGLGGGYGLLWLLRHLRVPQSVYPVLALMAVLVTFGGAQTIGASGFLATYVMGVILALRQFKAHRALVYAAEAFAWLAQITLFLLLGLLVTPHRLVPIIAPILGITAVLLWWLARSPSFFAFFRSGIPRAKPRLPHGSGCGAPCRST